MRSYQAANLLIEVTHRVLARFIERAANARVQIIEKIFASPVQFIAMQGQHIIELRLERLQRELLRRAEPRRKLIQVRDRLRGPLNRVFEPASLFLQLAAHAAVQAGMQAIEALFGFGCDGARRVTKRRDSLLHFAVEPLLNLCPQSLHGLRCRFCRATLQLCNRTFRKSFDVRSRSIHLLSQTRL